MKVPVIINLSAILTLKFTIHTKLNLKKKNPTGTPISVMYKFINSNISYKVPNISFPYFGL